MKKMILLLIICIVSQCYSLNLPSIFKHRCNTIEDMIQAKNEGFDGVEMDLQIAKHKVPIMTHDKDFLTIPIPHIQLKDMLAINNRVITFTQAIIVAKRLKLKLIVHINSWSNHLAGYIDSVLEKFEEIASISPESIFCVMVHDYDEYLYLKDKYNVYYTEHEGYSTDVLVNQSGKNRTWKLVHKDRGLEGYMSDDIFDVQNVRIQMFKQQMSNA